MYENELWQSGYRHVCGVDEAGRGPLAGPVVAAAVILPQDFWLATINDSKKISESLREKLFDEIYQTAVAVGVGIVSPEEIDRINILQATLSAMRTAIESLTVQPDVVLVDGRDVPRASVPCKAIVKGDSLSLTIAAASIIAKVTRDRIMQQYDSQYPQYGFARHKGYGTRDHRERIMRFGACPIHRQSFLGKITQWQK
jgi:ribonuclease HII